MSVPRCLSVLPPVVSAGIALLVLGVVGAQPATGQVDLAAAEFQAIQPHPYVHALGNATVAARGYPGATGVNPATIGMQGTVQMGSNVNLSRGPLASSPWIFPEYWMTAPSGTVKMGRWAGGVQVKHFSRESHDVRGPGGERQGTVQDFDQSVALVGAYDVTPRITVGAGVNLIRSRIYRLTGEEIKVQPTVDVGLHYESEIERESLTVRPALGLSLTDFGGNISYEHRRGDRAAPTTVRGGGALEARSESERYGRPGWRIGVYGALSNLLINGERIEEDGVEYVEADGPFQSLITGWGATSFAVTGEGSEVGSWERLKKHVGLEMAVLDILSFRLGRFHESDVNGGRQYTALGFGIDGYYVALDASWTLGDDPFEEFSYGRLTLRLPLSESSRNFWPALLGRSE